MQLGRQSPRSTSRRASTRAVGAFPTATTAPSPTRSADRLIAAADRVRPSRAASRAVASSSIAQATSTPSGPARSRRTPARSICTSATIGAPRRRAATAASTAPGANLAFAAKSKSAEAWIIRRTTARSPGSPGCGPNSRSIRASDSAMISSPTADRATGGGGDDLAAKMRGVTILPPAAKVLGPPTTTVVNMVTSALASSPRRTISARSPGRKAFSTRPTGVSGERCERSRSATRGLELPRPRPAGRVVEDQHEIGAGGGLDTLEDRLPGGQQVAQADARPVVRQGRSQASRRRERRGDAGDDHHLGRLVALRRAGQLPDDAAAESS